ncbi:hypothetical protein, partial [Massilia sp. DWR3-1-1]|uniref:hypothetical protein n=1 Tax=Massilia sp. DWR3-1-1 TaxID=2804559 RepID=UPI003CF3D116
QGPQQFQLQESPDVRVQSYLQLINECMLGKPGASMYGQKQTVAFFIVYPVFTLNNRRMKR